jgi:hypothetical protein
MPTKSKRPKATGTGSEDWLTRRAELRQMEWALHRALLDAGQQALTRWAAKPDDASPAEIARLITLGSELGRLSSGLPGSHSEAQPIAAPSIRLEIEAALQKAYGGDT